MSERDVMSNVLTAFRTIVNNYQMDIKQVTNGSNRANNMGDGLEEYIKNAFANTINETDEQTRL
jgi:Trp operon repressor